MASLENTEGTLNGAVSSHPIFQKDPAEWMQYVYKEVCVTTASTTCFTGRVYSIDPVSQMIMLATFDGQTIVRVQAIMGHAVQDIVVVDNNVEKYRSALDNLFKPVDHVALSPEELKEKQEHLRTWLAKNRIPVQVSGENCELLVISNALTIEPPYGVKDCQSTNEIILGRIQGLIANMPKDAYLW